MRKIKTLIGLILLLGIFGCKKTEKIYDLQITTKEITSIMINSASSGGVIDNSDNLTILEVGICWDTLSLPTISSNKTIESVQEHQSFEFNSSLKGLLSSKEYYVRAYARTNEHIFYGNQYKFSTIPLDSFIVDFEFILNQDYAPCKLTLINNSKYSNSFNWSFEGANIPNSDNPTPINIEYSNGGTYIISLTGCTDKHCQTINKTINIENSDIEFNDPVLEKRIRICLNKPTGSITKSYAKSITNLNLSKALSDSTYIKNIDVLKYFTSLKILNLSNNKVFDLIPLSNLIDLEILDLYNNEISAITPLENLKKLKELNLWLNNVEDIGALSQLTFMEKLNIGANKIVDISPIKGITSIKSLWLNANYYTVDTSTIKSLTNLTTLGVTNCKLHSINFVKDLTNLVDLLFENNYVTDISVLKNFSKLRSLFCGYNNIKDFTVLENLYNNGCFRLSKNFIYHINIANNGIDAKNGTENRRIIDLLTSNSVIINWQAGNSY